MNLKDLSENYIKKFAGSTIYDRGYDYYKTGHVYNFEYFFEQEKVVANVLGNYGDYEVEIISKNNNIDACCDCPYDGYPCKHIVAVLLEFINNKTEYIEVSNKETKSNISVENKLLSLSKEELVKIILESIKKYPDFKRELQVILNSDDTETINSIIKQINKAFPNISSKHYSLDDTRKKLSVILKSIENASEKMKIEIYWAVADRVIEELNEYGMDEESIEDIAIDCLEKLPFLLEDKKELQPKKQLILDSLIKHYIKGNCGIIDTIYDIAKEMCSERSDYLILINNLKNKRDEKNFKSYYTEFLANLYSKIGDETSEIEVLESDLKYGGDYWRLAEFWLRKNNQEKVLSIVLEGIKKGKGRKDELYLYLQDYYKQQNDYNKIFELLNTKIAENDYSSRDFQSDPCYNLLYDYYKKQNNYEGIKKLLELRLIVPDFELYKDAKAILTDNDFSSFEYQIIKKLETKRNVGCDFSKKKTLAQIYSFKKDMENLYNVIKNDATLMEEYENQLVKLYPEVYLRQYCSNVNHLIGLQGRTNYQRAVDYLKSIKKIYINFLKKQATWEDYINNLKKSNKQLRALQEELKKAGL